MEYSEDGRPLRIDTIVISTQHHPDAPVEELQEPLEKYIIRPVLEEAKMHLRELDIDTYNLFINPTGRFVKGGPAADSGLTGRKSSWTPTAGTQLTEAAPSPAKTRRR